VNEQKIRARLAKSRRKFRYEYHEGHYKAYDYAYGSYEDLGRSEDKRGIPIKCVRPE
jgi:hypothetical protein